MNTGLDFRKTWARVSLYLGLGLGFVSAAMIWERITEPAVLTVLLGVIGLNVFAIGRHASGRRAVDESDPVLSTVRYIQGAAMVVIGYLPGLHEANLWLLGIPLLLAEAMSSDQRLRVAGLAGLMILVQGAAEYSAHGTLAAAALPAALFGLAGVSGVALAGYKAREEVLAMRDRRLAAVLDCGTTYASSRDLKSTLLHTLKAAVAETRATCGYMMLAEVENQGPLISEVAYGTEGEFEFPPVLDFGSGLTGYVAKMGQPIAISGTSGESETLDGVMTGVRSALAVPMVTRSYTSVGRSAEDQVLGVITLLSLRAGHAFSAEDVDLVRTLAALAAVAVANARMEEKQQSTFVRTLESLATALEARDEYTQGHSRRVCEISLMLGERMGYSSEALEELRVGTVLHDIGKIGVPDAILNKRGALTDEEFEIMKTHPVIGYEICKPLMLSEGVLMIIRNHHEKLDGTGYPDGLKGGELPLSLRIVCVADAFDAMSSRRPYRAVMEQSEVIAELSRCAGTQFDPVVVETLKAILDTDRVRHLYSTRADAEYPQWKAA